MSRRRVGPAPPPRAAAGPIAVATLLPWRHPAAVCFLVALLLYLPALRGTWAWDDHWLIESSAVIHGGGFDLRRLLFGDLWAPTGEASGYWRPLTVVSYALDGALSHWNPAWFHAVNVLLHAGTSAVVATLVLASGAPAAAALAGGLWFATLPSAVESVAWVSGRPDPLYVPLLALALLVDRSARGRGAGRPPALALVFFALALLAKETAAVFLPLLALVEGARIGGTRPRRLWWLVPYVAFVVVWLAAHAAVTARRSFPHEALAAIGARGVWAALTLVPRILAWALPGAHHSPAPMVAVPAGPGAPVVIVGALANVGMLAAIVVLTRRRAPEAAGLALAWLALLAPEAAVAGGTVLVAERYLYLPALGLAWAGGAALGRLRQPARAAGVAAVIALAIAGAIVTTRLIPRWRDDEALFEYAAEAEPRSARAQANWAMILAQQARDAEAIAAIARAQALNPRLPEAYFARALLHFGRKRWNESAASADTAIALDTLRIEPRVTRALALVRARRAAEAEPDLGRLMALAPGNPFVESAYGQCELALGRPAVAAPWLDRAYGLIANDPEVALAAGWARLARRDLVGAHDAFEHALTLDSSAAQPWIGLSEVYATSGDTAARDHARARARSLEASPAPAR